VGSNHRHQHY